MSDTRISNALKKLGVLEGLSPLWLGVVTALVLGSIVGLWWLLSWNDHRVDKRAGAEVLAPVLPASITRSVLVNKANSQTSESVNATQRKIVKHRQAVVDGGDAEFFAGVCDSGFYEGDPACRKPSGGRGGDGGSK